MTINVLKQVVLSDVIVVKEVKSFEGGPRVILFEGDLDHPEVDPEILKLEIELVQAVSTGKIRIIIKN
jgi:hypothetical protein